MSNKKMDKNLDRFPEALKSQYSTPFPNATIELFKGNLELTLESGSRISAPGRIEWKWLPSPSIRLSCTSFDSYPDPSDLSRAAIDIPVLNMSGEVIVTNMGVDKTGTHYGGLLQMPMLIDGDSDCDRAVFHLPNFFSVIGEAIREEDGAAWAGRFCLESDEWIVTVDRKRSTDDLLKSLKDQGGYAITHTGELRRTDERSFGFSEANDALQAVYFFLSFARGLWSGPILTSGRVSNTNVWQEWTTSRLTPWKYVNSWFPRIGHRGNLNKLSKAFRGFMRKWNNAIWKAPIKHSIHWYVESNIGAGGVEGAIVLTQAALELLSWLYFADDKMTAKYSVNHFGRFNATEKIRKLLKELDIPVTIPTSLRSLQREVVTLQVADGPEAFVRLRNMIVHSKKSKRDAMLQISMPARLEAQNLGLWYLEMILLRTCGYEGEYYNRFESGWPNQMRCKVPWVQQSKLK
jgi:hypothetical protein